MPVKAIIAVEPVGPPFRQGPAGSLAWGLTASPLQFDPPASRPEDITRELRAPVKAGTVPEVFGAPMETLEPGEHVIGFNVWRPMNGPPQDVPLALCDSRNAAHRWMYYRDMQPDEVLIFRSYDSRPVWRPGVPHSAFDDPRCPPDVPARMSFEARAVVVVRSTL
jgi:hypothetical protein